MMVVVAVPKGVIDAPGALGGFGFSQVGCSGEKGLTPETPGPLKERGRAALPEQGSPLVG